MPAGVVVAYPRRVSAPSRRTLTARVVLAALTVAYAGSARAEPAEAPAPESDESDEAEAPAEGDAEEAAEGEGEGEGETTSSSAPLEPAGAAARPPMIEVIPKDKRVRHDWYIGFGWGAGVGVVRGASLTHGVGLGTSGFIHAGGRVRDPVHLGGRLSTLTGAGYGASSILVEALFFPLIDKGLIIGAAVGPSLVYPVVAGQGPGMNMAAQNGKVALAAALDLGYDFWLLRRFNVGVLGRADAAFRPGLGLLLTGTVGLSFNWY